MGNQDYGSEDRITFVEQCRTGTARPDQIKDSINAWYNSRSDLTLAGFLGMTEEEYKRWDEDPNSIIEIISRVGDEECS